MLYCRWVLDLLHGYLCKDDSEGLFEDKASGSDADVGSDKEVDEGQLEEDGTESELSVTAEDTVNPP